MATLWVCEGYEKAFNRKISAYTDKLEDIQAQYTKSMKYVNSYTGDSQVDNTCVYLKKRKKALQASIDEAEALKKRVNSYASTVLAADRTVADSVHKKAYSFYQKKGIGPRSDAWYDKAGYTIQTTAEDFYHDALGTAARIVDSIHEFYEENKYLINIGLDIVKLMGTVALFTTATLTGPIGIACAIGATWAATKAVYELSSDTVAAIAWMDGDLELAEEYANRTLAGDLISFGEWLDETVGAPHVFEVVAKTAVFGFEACQFTASLVCIYENFRECFNLNKQLGSDNILNWTFVRNTSGRTWAECFNDKYMSKPFHPTRLLNPANWIKFAGKNAGFSLKMNVTTAPEIVWSFFDNWKKNKDVLLAYKESGWSAFWKLNPIVKERNKFKTAIEEIIME